MYALVWLMEFFTVSWHRSRGGDEATAVPYYLGQKISIIALSYLSFYHHFLVLDKDIDFGFWIIAVSMIISYVGLEWAWNIFGNEKYHWGSRWDHWHIFGSGPSHYFVGGAFIYTFYGLSPFEWGYAALGSMVVWALRRTRQWDAPTWMPAILWEKIRKYLPDWKP